MSWDMWHVSGFGIVTTSDLIDEEKMIAFIKNHHDSLEKANPKMTASLDEFIKEVEEAGDDVDFDIDEEIKNCTDSCSYGEIVATVMKEETEIGFSWTGIDDNGEEGVIFEPALPWQLSEKEKNLTGEDLTKIFKKYGSELCSQVYVGNMDFVFSG